MIGDYQNKKRKKRNIPGSNNITDIYRNSLETTTDFSQFSIFPSDVSSFTLGRRIRKFYHDKAVSRSVHISIFMFNR